MKGMKIAVAVIAVLIVVGLGVALMNSGGGPRRNTTPSTRSTQTAQPAPLQVEMPETNQSAASTQGKRTVAPPPVQSPVGMNVEQVRKEFDQLNSLAQLSVLDGQYERAIEMRREQNKKAAMLNDFTASAPVYMEIARAEFLKGDYDRVENDLRSVLIMGSVTRSEPEPTLVDDVEVMRASIALAKDEIDAAAKQIALAKKSRIEAQGAAHPSNAEVTMHEGLLEDLRGNYEKADQLYNEAIPKLAAARETEEGRYYLQNSLWILKKSAETRASRDGAEADPAIQAQQRLESALAEAKR
jgi:hypothetical protein